MKRSNGKRTPSNPDPDASGERRRFGRVVHDDRGAASLEWHDAPDDLERPVFELEGPGSKQPLSIKNDDTFNPYDRTPDSSPTSRGRTGKRDLKKLSEWLKLMREMEARKNKGED